MRLFLVSSAVGLALNAYGSVMDDFVYTYSKGEQCIFAKPSAETRTIYEKNKNKDSYDSVADNAFGTTINGKTTLKNSFKVSHWLVNMAREISEKKEMMNVFNDIKYENLNSKGEKISYTIIEKLLNKSNLKANNDPDKNVIDDANMYYNGWYLKSRFDFENKLNKKINNIENENLKKICKIVQNYSEHTNEKILCQDLKSIKNKLAVLFNSDQKKLKEAIEKETGEINKDVLTTIDNFNPKLTLSELVDNNSKENAVNGDKNNVLDYNEISKIENIHTKECISAKDIKGYKRIENCFSYKGEDSYYYFMCKSIEFPESLEFISEKDFWTRDAHNIDKLEKIIIPNSWQVKIVNNEGDSYVYFITNSSVFRLLLGKKIKIFKHDGNEVTPTELISKNGDGYYSLNIGNNIKKLECKIELSNKGEDELEKLKLPDSLEEIGDNCFYNYENLKTVKFGKNLKKLGKFAFSGCNMLEELLLPESLEEIGEACFSKCEKLKTVKFGKNLKKLGKSAFSSCTMLNEISLPDTLEEIGEFCFSSCKNLKTVKFGKNLKKLGKFAFSDCAMLEEVLLPDTLEEIGNGCFKNCENLKSVRLGKNLKKLENSVFGHCYSLETVNSECNWRVLKDCFSEVKCDSGIKIYTYLDEEDFTSDYLIESTIMESLLKNLEYTFKVGGNLIIKNRKGEVVGFIGSYSVSQAMNTAKVISNNIIQKFQNNFKLWFTMNDVYKTDFKNGQLDIPAECKYVHFYDSSIPDKKLVLDKKYPDKKLVLDKKYKDVKSIKFSDNLSLVSGSKDVLPNCSYVSSSSYSKNILNFTHSLKSVQKVSFAEKDCSTEKANDSSNEIKNNISFTSLSEEDKKRVNELHIYDGTEINNEIDKIDKDKKSYNKSGFLTIGYILENYKNIKNIVIDFDIPENDLKDDWRVFKHKINEAAPGYKGIVSYKYRDLGKFIYDPENIEKMTTINGKTAIVDISKYKDKGFDTFSKIYIDSYFIDDISSVCYKKNITDVELILPNDLPLVFDGRNRCCTNLGRDILEPEIPISSIETKINKIKINDQDPKELKIVNFSDEGFSDVNNLFPALKSFDFGEKNTLTKIPNRMFKQCMSLETIEFPSNLEEMGSYSFYYCSSIKKIDFPDTLKKLGSNAFALCDLEKVVLPYGIKEVGELCFVGNKKLKSLVQLSSYRSDSQVNTAKQIISENSTEDVMQESVIGPRAFYRCKSLESIDLPNINRIDADAFFDCYKLNSVKLGNIKQIGLGSFAVYYNTAKRFCCQIIFDIGENIPSIFDSTFLYRLESDVIINNKTLSYYKKLLLEQSKNLNFLQRFYP